MCYFFFLKPFLEGWGDKENLQFHDFFTCFWNMPQRNVSLMDGAISIVWVTWTPHPQTILSSILNDIALFDNGVLQAICV